LPVAQKINHSDSELHLSNQGQLELLLSVLERNLPFRMAVQGFSMYPFICNNDVLTITPMSDQIPRVGNVVAFVETDTKRLAIHRVIAQVGLGWHMQGDNTPKPDVIVLRENIIGVVTRIERRGRDVRFGLGAEAWLIALLQRAHVLMGTVRIVEWFRRR
jgi:signal peptidase I